MLVVSGGGFVTDVFPGQAWPVFERLLVACESRVPFALMGQGIGPLRDPSLVAAAKSTLPRAELIAVREPLYSVPLLLELGVARDRILVTGDDAIEPAYRARRAAGGSDIGGNLRIAMNTAKLRSTLQVIAVRNSARLIALPVCVADSADTASDATVIETMLQPGDISATHGTSMTATSLIERFADCRLVVTGSYHAAVFALSQGIPAVCVFKSEYYEMKFRGLRAQFGEGCELIDMATGNFEIKLASALDSMWLGAEALRPSLLVAAENQIGAGNQAYDRLGEILERLMQQHSE
jgi:polysaccharide pyruvyl transferase WcaK-like protein